MFHFGFSYVGLIYLLMLFIPNGIWTKNQPKNYEKYVDNEKKIYVILERMGEILVCPLVLIFSDFNIRKSYWMIILVISFFLMVLYEIYWIRYFKSEKTMKDFYSGILGIPVAGATLPVVAFFLLGIYGSNIFLIVSSIILGIGHIGIHLDHKKEVDGPKEKEPKTLGKIFKGIFKWFFRIILILILLYTIAVIAIRNIKYISDVSASAKNGVLETEYVALGGQEQYIMIQGNDIENPVIVYLHGGPCSPDTYITSEFTKFLADDYTVISWDQRGCGRTYFKNIKNDPDCKTVSFDQAVEDVDDLVDYACNRFGKDQVIIVGWSYGSLLGSKYIIEHPEKVSNYIGIGQFVDFDQSNILCYEAAAEKAKAEKLDTTNLEKAYNQYMKSKSLSDVSLLRQFTTLILYSEQTHMANTISLAMFSPYFSMDDFKFFAFQVFNESKLMKINSKLYDTLNVKIQEFGTEYKVPVYYISGNCDYTCNYKLAEEYLNEVTAPEKKMLFMDGCGHSAHYDNPTDFAEKVKAALNK